MRVFGKEQRTIWLENDRLFAIDQTRLPHAFERFEITGLKAACEAIRTMQVRGAPLIGVTAAFGVALGLRERPHALDAVCAELCATRPTAVNLRWAVERVRERVRPVQPSERSQAALALARDMAEEDVAACRRLAEVGLPLLRPRSGDLQRPVQVLTHCNAGWLAAIDWGTALAPVYLAAERGIAVHVWVDETRPRNQGASLTAWELSAAGIACTVVADNAGGHLMQRGEVDLCIVGTDRTTRNGDVCNKIGTYLKALAARDNEVPFYVALPTSSLDLSLATGREVPIEERSPDEVHMLGGSRITPEGVAARNPAFDVTPAALVTRLITERGLLAPGELAEAFDDRR